MQRKETKEKLHPGFVLLHARQSVIVEVWIALSGEMPATLLYAGTPDISTISFSRAWGLFDT
jgi:hypothetical protein